MSYSAVTSAQDEQRTRQSALRIGILGGGNIGTVHLQSAHAMDNVTVAGVADTVPERREQATALGARNAYEDYRTLLTEEDLDVCVVALPPFLHSNATIEAARAGAHVFVEKPFARTPAEAREMIAVADRCGVKLGVDHTLRYQPEIKRLKSEYDSGRLGHVPLAVISRVNDGPFDYPEPSRPVADWQLDPDATGGGALMDLGVHLLDVFEWFFGEMEVCHAELETQLNLDYEDTASLVLKSQESGTIGVLNCGFFQWETPPDINSYMRLDGITESLESEDFLPDNFYVHAAKAATENMLRRVTGSELSYFSPTYYYRAHFDALGAFLTAVREDRTPPVTGEDGLRTIELVTEAYERTTGPSLDPDQLGRE